jgi:hypothetical protein
MTVRVKANRELILNTEIMKTTRNGYRINKNGKVIKGIEKDAIVKDFHISKILEEKTNRTIKENGVYYFFERKQGNNLIYLP